jgi:hypothetical protein
LAAHPSDLTAPICASEYPASRSTSVWKRVHAMPENVVKNASALTSRMTSRAARH